LGNTTKLDAEHMVKYTCDTCGEELFARSNHGKLKCFCGYTMTPKWGEAQLCFMPDDGEVDKFEADTSPEVKIGRGN